MHKDVSVHLQMEHVVIFCDLVQLRNTRLWSAESVLTRSASRHSHEQMQAHGLRPPSFQLAAHELWLKRDLK